MINVTKTYLPPLEEYTKHLEKIWKSGQVTNNGTLAQELENKLKNILGVKYVLFTSNGTIAIQIAIKALALSKEIITTPFSYVATTTAILWENCIPVFADIDKNSLCIDPAKIEEKITSNTEAILATHVYGFPCHIEAIEKIAKKHNLKVIYDAAHAFGTQYKNNPLTSYGDVSTLSFHATKLFHTIEGGAIATNDDVLAKKMKLYRGFGHIGDDYFTIGINGKNSEFHAAMGLCILDKVPDLIEKRKQLSKAYNEQLNDLGLFNFKLTDDTVYNYAYYPLLLENEDILLEVKTNLYKHDIIPRRYFYPSLNKLPYISFVDSCPVSENYSSRILCLPLYYDLSIEQVEKISSIIKTTLNK